MNAIIATCQDLDSLAITDPIAHAEFITQLRASLTTRMDVQAYPEDYDRTLLPEAPGYIAPVYEVHDTPEIAARFGLAGGTGRSRPNARRADAQVDDLFREADALV